MSSSSSEVISEIKRVSVDSGSCGEWGPCALSVDHCELKTDWLSSRRVVSSHSSGCTSSKRTQSSKIGTCSDDGPCASVKELCAVPALFQPRHKNCEVMENELTVTKMAYGSCVSSSTFGDERTCFWSNDFCDNKGSFDFDASCTCDKVRVGACHRDNYPDVFHCAVSEAACDTDQTFLSVMDLKAKADCYLCREPPAAPTTTTVAPLPPPSSPPVGNPSPTSLSSSSGDSLSSSSLDDMGETMIPPTSSSSGDSSSSSDDMDEMMTNTAGSLATFNNNAGDTFTSKPGEILSSTKNADINNKSLGGIIVGSIGGAFVAVFLLIFVSRKVRQNQRTGRQEVTSDGDVI